MDREAMIEFMNAYNAAHREGRYYSKRAEEIIIENGGMIVTSNRTNKSEDGK